MSDYLIFGVIALNVGFSFFLYVREDFVRANHHLIVALFLMVAAQ